MATVSIWMALPSFRRKESVTEVSDREPVALNTRRSSSQQVVLLVDVLLQSPVGVVPHTEVIQLTTELFCPLAILVSVKREVRVRLLWLVGSA